VGPVFAGYIFDIYSSYQFVLLTFIGITIVAVILILIMSEPVKNEIQSR
jgi:cyanate permease